MTKEGGRKTEKETEKERQNERERQGKKEKGWDFPFAGLLSK